MKSFRKRFDTDRKEDGDRLDKRRSTRRGSVSDTQSMAALFANICQNPGISLDNIVDIRGTFVLMSEVCWGTYGDYFAGFKLINACRQRNPYMRIVWLILDKHSGVPNEVTSADEVYLFKDWKKLFDVNHPATTILKDCHAILQFPTFHFLSDIGNNYLKNICKPAVEPTECLEYDYVMNNKKTTSQVISAGLGDNCVGIFLDDYGNAPAEERLTSLPDDIKKLLGTSAVDEGTYLTNHALFFGYRNKGEAAVVSKEVNIPNFVSIIAELSTLDETIIDKPVVDVIVPINKAEEFMLDKARLAKCGFKELILINKKGQKRTVALNSTGNKTLRLINPFRLDNADMKILIASAHPFILCTGDQSLSEVISKNNPGQRFVSLPFYQVMVWKVNLFAALRMLVKQVCGADSALDCYFRAATDIIDPEDFAALVCEPKLQQDMLKLYVFIAEYKNLYRQLPEFIEQQMLRNGAVLGSVVTRVAGEAAEACAEELLDDVIAELLREVVFEEMWGCIPGQEKINIQDPLKCFNEIMQETFKSYQIHSGKSYTEILFTCNLNKHQHEPATTLIELYHHNDYDSLNIQMNNCYNNSYNNSYNKINDYYDYHTINSYNKIQQYSDLPKNNSFFNIPYPKDEKPYYLHSKPPWEYREILNLPKIPMFNDQENTSEDDEDNASPSCSPLY